MIKHHRGYSYVSKGDLPIILKHYCLLENMLGTRMWCQYLKSFGKVMPNLRLPLMNIIH